MNKYRIREDDSWVKHEDLVDSARYAFLHFPWKVTEKKLENGGLSVKAVVPVDFNTARRNGKRLIEEDINKMNIFSDLFNDMTMSMRQTLNEAPFTPKSIEQSADHKTVVVIWNDRTKTIVKLSPNDPDDIYMAFTAALAKKIFGTNSHIKKVIATHLNEHKPKKESRINGLSQNDC